MICDKEASDDFMRGDDMSNYGLYIIEAKDGPFYSYAERITDIRHEFTVVSVVDADKREGLESEWTDTQGCNHEPDYEVGNYFDNPTIWRTQNDV